MMATTLSAVLQTGRRVAVTIEGLPVLPALPGDPWPATPWTLYRTDGTSQQPVRGAADRPLTDSPATVVYDREQPLNTPFTYLVRYVDAVDGAVTVYALTPEGEPQWLTQPADYPVLSDPITGYDVELTAYVDQPEVKRDGRSSVFDVAGRSTPYVVVDQLGGATSTETLRTTTPAQRKQIRALLATGQTVYLRPACDGLDRLYLLATSVTETRITRRADDLRRLWTLECTHVAMPDPAIQAIGDTLEDLADAVPGTLQDIADTFTTLLEIAQTDLGGG